MSIRPMGPSQAGLAGAYAPKADPAFTGTVSLPGGSSSLRRPVNGSVVIDGSVAKTLPGDKVGYAFSATIQGGFTGDSGGTPTFAWGANDFIVTGSAAGDVAGLDNLTARETEMHLYTPGAAVTNMKGLQVDCKIEAPAVGATVGTMFGVYISPIAKAAGAVTAAYGLYIEQPTAGATNEAIHAVGAVGIVGPTTITGATVVNGALTHGSGAAKFAGASSGNVQGAAAGAYIGNLGGNYGVNLSDGTNAWGIDLSSGTLRFMKAGVQQNAAIDLSGNLTVRGGLTFGPATSSSATAGGSSALPATPAGYATVTIGGTAQKIPYYAV